MDLEHLVISLLQILVMGACTIFSTIYGFKAAVREFGLKLEEGLKTKIDLSEYRAKVSELHGGQNAANIQIAVQQNEITHLKAVLAGSMPATVLDLDKTPPAGTKP
jgi:hypothetical protein